MKHKIKKLFIRLDKIIDIFYRPFAKWLISLNNKQDIDWLNMQKNMQKDRKNED